MFKAQLSNNKITSDWVQKTTNAQKQYLTAIWLKID